MIVVDSSVILKCFLKSETEADLALRLVERHQSGQESIMAPDLLAYEVANVLTCKGHLTNEEVLKGVADLLSFEVSFVRFEPIDYFKSIETARQFHLTVYDAAYVHLAQTLGCHFITADEKLSQKTKALPYVRHLQYLPN